MDHYEALGVRRDASKDEIKDAFRRLALKLHPDKHALSSDANRRAAALRFQRVSEAYGVLADLRKRKDYDLRSAGGATFYGHAHRSYAGGGGGGGAGFRPAGDGVVSRFENVLRYFTTRAFLLNAAFAGALLGGMVLIDIGRESLWKMHNPGKSFEEAIQSIEKAKTNND